MVAGSYGLTRRHVLAALGAVPFAAAAQEGEAAWAETVKRAQAEGRLNLYSVAPPDQGQRLVDAFTRRYPAIRVSMTRGAGDLPPRIAAERASGVDGGDVFLFSDPLWFKENADHLLALDGPSNKKFPSDHWIAPGKAPLVSYPPMGMIVWNKKFVPGGIKGYPDLLNPAFRGKIGARQDMTAFLAAFLEWQEQTFGPEFLRQFGAQKPKYYASVVPMVQAVASGEIWIASTSVPSSAKDLMKQGAPIDYVVPQRTFAISWAAGALAASRRPNAARVFLDFVMSEEGQTALNGDGDGGSPLAVPGTLKPGDLTILDLSLYGAAKRDEWRRKFKEYFP